MVISIYLEDIRKKYAKRMEFWGKVRDGSKSEIGDGYPLCKAVATDIESKKIIPLYREAYSLLSEEVKSENSQLLNRNTVVLVLAVSYLPSVYLGLSIKLKILAERIFLVSKRFGGIPSFFNYAIADGIFNLLYPNNLDDFQLDFDFG